MTYIQKLSDELKQYYPDKELKFLANGGWGCVYTYDDRVVKVTYDISEYEFASSLIGKKKTRLVRVYKAFVNPNNHSSFIIECELVTVRCLQHVYSDFYNLFKHNLVDFLTSYQTNKKDVEVIIRKKEFRTFRHKNLIKEFIQIARTFSKLNLICFDIHKYNVGFRGDKLVLLDLGCIQTK